jgi:hypothetical protein
MYDGQLQGSDRAERLKANVHPSGSHDRDVADAHFQ